MPETTGTPQSVETPEAIQTEITSLRSAPFGAGESQLDRSAKLEAAYKKLHPEDGPVAQDDATKDGEQQQGKAQPVEIDWQDPEDSEISPEVAGVRQGLQTYFGELGLPSEQATGLIGVARKYSTATVSDSEVFTKQRASEDVLRAEWGDAFEANARAVRVLIRDFEKHFNHPDLDAAIENGLWLDPDINRALLEVARRQDPVKGDLKAIRKELMTVNQGSARWHELQRGLEAGYKKLHGTGS